MVWMGYESEGDEDEDGVEWEDESSAFYGVLRDLVLSKWIKSENFK